MSQQSELNARLQQLALAAQRYPPRSPERRRQLHRLFLEIQQCRRLAHYRSLCPPQLQGCYQEIYEDAVQTLFRFMTENIDRYEAEKGDLLQWANGHLRYRFLDTVRTYQSSDRRTPPDIRIISLDELETMPETQSSKSAFLSEQIIQIIEEDPEGLFAATYTCGNSQANFQWIALKRSGGYGWKEISQELGVEISALSNFYQRCLGKFKITIQKYLAN